jgi:hypothetical protein
MVVVASVLAGCAVAVEPERTLDSVGRSADASPADASPADASSLALDAVEDAPGREATAPGAPASDAATALDADGRTGPCPTLGEAECAAATELEEVDGDRGSEVRVAKGRGNAFFKIKVKDTTWGAVSRIRVTVDAPGGDFDLYVHQGPDLVERPGAAHECRELAKSAITRSNPEVLGYALDRILGRYNPRWVTIEIRTADEVCPAGEWTLTVEANKR